MRRVLLTLVFLFVSQPALGETERPCSFTDGGGNWWGYEMELIVDAGATDRWDQFRIWEVQHPTLDETIYYFTVNVNGASATSSARFADKRKNEKISWRKSDVYDPTIADINFHTGRHPDLIQVGLNENGYLKWFEITEDYFDHRKKNIRRRLDLRTGKELRARNRTVRKSRRSR